MKILNVLSFAVLTVGGLNWGLVGLFDWNWFEALFGGGSPLARLAHMVVGATALWQFVPLFSAFESDLPPVVKER